VTDLKTTKK